MKLFELKSPVQANGDLVSLNDTNGRLSDYFIWNDGDDKFLKFKPLRGEAQDFITPQQIQAADFLEADVGIPIFSAKAREALAREIPEELDFYQVTITVRSAEYQFFLAKIRLYRDLIDDARSTFRTLRGGEKILQVAAYRSDLIHDFAIARDKTYCPKFAVTQQMLDIIQANGLNINYDDAT